MAFADTQKLVVQLDLKGNLNAKLGEAARAVQGFDKATSNTQRSLSRFGRNIERGVVLGIAATGTALLGVVKAAADYESAFAGVRKTVSATEPELKALSEGFRQLSKEIPISASELARLGEAGGALGVPTAQLKEFVRVTALIGVTTNLSADEAANSLGILGNVLHLTGAEYSKFASSLVALGNAGASTESDIIAISERIGAAGHLIGVSTQDILGFSSAVASLGIESEAGGTALQKFFIDSAKKVAGGGKDLKEFATVAGVSAKAFKKAFAEDASGALQDFLAGLGKLSQSKQLTILEDLGFNDARITRTLLGLANNTKLVSDQMGVANKAFAENTALTKEAEQRFNTFDSQLTITKNVLTDMAITIGSKLLPKITPLLKRLNEFIGQNQGKISEFGDKLATGFEKFADALQKVDWKPFIDGLKLSASIAKTAIDLFMSLPNEVKAAAIGAFAVNKLTGGLPVAVAKDVGGAVLGHFAARGSSPANPLWVAQVGGPGGLLGGAIPAAEGAAAAGGLGVGTIVAGIAAGAAISALGIMGLGWLITATSSPEQLAKGAQNAIDQNRQKHGLSTQTGTAASRTADAEISARRTEAAENRQSLVDNANRINRDAEINARRIEAEENRTGKLVGVNGKFISHTITVLGAQFGKDIKGLKAATKPVDIAKFAKAIAADVAKGSGSVAGTQGVLKELKIKLAETHDPKLQAVLRRAIHDVQVKLPNRQWVDKELALGRKIADSSGSSSKRIADLKTIETSLRAHGDRHAAAQIRKLEQQIAATKRVTVAELQTRQAVKDKDLSVTTNVTVRASLSLHGQSVTRVRAASMGFNQ